MIKFANFYNLVTESQETPTQPYTSTFDDDNGFWMDGNNR